ncbi:MAG: DUF4118 domain-containing protein [Methanomassiliicoccales archaeon]|nr:DUF4118 domain-containing protein [Methanomassiliicoccales archaeon]
MTVDEVRKDGRPEPSFFLDMANNEERKKNRGKLTIFLGYSAGVGKTYAMLEDAHQRQKNGVDVVIACVVTHGRKETEELVKGLGSVPLKDVEHHGIHLMEMDVDAVIARNPDLALVDEFAHTNIGGSRHLKRYQDVRELLEAGIDVYTTLNIQHLESMNNVVAQITNVKVQETIPDTVIEEANEIKVVDLPPKDLLQRFKEGKVYVPEQAIRAMDNFFNEGNLIALREMALRAAAEHVDGQMLEYMRARSIQGPWPVNERLLVCIGNSKELNERLIRTGKRLADEIKAEWHVIYIETPASKRLTKQSRLQAIEGIDLASSLGAETTTTFGITIAEEIIRYAKKNNITRIIVGRTKRPIWHDYVFGSVINQLVSFGSEFDIMIINGPRTKNDNKREEGEKKNDILHWKHGAYCTWIVLLFTILDVLLRSVLEETNLIMVYLIGVVITAILWGIISAVFTAIVSTIMFNFFFVEPHYSFEVNNTQYVISMLAFLFVGVVISLLVVKARDNAQAAQRRDEYTSIQYSLSLDLVKATSIETVVEAMEYHIERACRSKSVYLLPFDGDMKVIHSSDGIIMDSKELGAARWAFTSGISTGKDTDTLSTAKLKYHPVQTPNGTLGVIGILMEDVDSVLKIEQERIIQSFMNQAGLAIERIELSKRLSSTTK